MKIKQSLIDILKGVVIGAACVIPGVSGGTIAVIMGIYDGLLSAISNLRKQFKKSLMYIWPFAVGIVVGLVGMIIPLKFAMDHIPLPTILFFVALIIGGLPPLTLNVARKPNVTGFLSFFLSLALAVGLIFIKTGSDINLSGTLDWWIYVALLFVGLLASATLVIPGISGSMILLILGFWSPIMNAASELIKFINIGNNILVLGLFGLGIIVGFFAISKLITFCFKRFRYATYMSIIGFVIGSIFTIFYTSSDIFITDSTNIPLTIALSIVLFIVGLTLSLGLSLYKMKKDKIALKGVDDVGRKNEEN